MIQRLGSILMVSLFSYCYLGAQTALLEDFDFQKGNYVLLMLTADFGNPVNDSAISYTDDPSVLGRVKADFVFDEEPLQFRSLCTDDLILYICRDGQLLESIGIDNRCRAINSSKGSFLYEGLQSVRATKPAHAQIDHFAELATARIALDSLSKVPGLIYLVQPPWAQLEGQFDFYKERDLRSAAEVTAELEAQIHNAYPDEPFEIRLNSAGGSSDKGWNYHVLVTSNPSLFHQFRLYPPTYGGWKPFPLELVSYWKSGN